MSNMTDNTPYYNCGRVVTYELNGGVWNLHFGRPHQTLPSTQSGPNKRPLSVKLEQSDQLHQLNPSDTFPTSVTSLYTLVGPMLTFQHKTWVASHFGISPANTTYSPVKVWTQ